MRHCRLLYPALIALAELTASADPVSATGGGAPSTTALAVRDAAMSSARDALAAETARYGGWETWKASLAPFRSRWQEQIDGHSAAPNGVITGHDGFLFLAGWEAYMLQTDYLHRPGVLPPAPATALEALTDLSQQLLDRNIHLIVAPVPDRSELYPEAFLGGEAPAMPVLPQRKEFLNALLERGVEGLDLLPPLEAAKGRGLVSLRHDTHWSPLGVEAAAAAIGHRLARYDLRRLYGTEATALRREPGTYERAWDIHARLPVEAQAAVATEPVSVQQVLCPDGTPYTAPAAAPLVIAGDSYVFYYKPANADLTAQVAAEIGYPVATLAAGGGKAPDIARYVARMPAAAQAQTRVIVFVFMGPYLRRDNWTRANLPPLEAQVAAAPDADAADAR